MAAVWKLACLLMCLRMSLAEPHASRAAQCPDAWIYFRNSCYLFANHILVDWIESSHYCSIHHGATLVSIESAAEQAFLMDKCKAFDMGSAMYWTGGSDEDIEGIWQWYPGNQDIYYTAWGPGEPNSNLGRIENCLDLHGPLNYMWNDESCYTHGHPLCELSLTGVVIGK